MIDRRLRSALLLLIWQMPVLLAFGLVLHVFVDHGHHSGDSSLGHSAQEHAETEGHHFCADSWPSATEILAHGHAHEGNTPSHDHAALPKLASFSGAVPSATWAGQEDVAPGPEPEALSVASEPGAGPPRVPGSLSRPDPPGPSGTSLLARLSILRI